LLSYLLYDTGVNETNEARKRMLRVSSGIPR